MQILPPTQFPDWGCAAAFNCGKDFYLASQCRRDLSLDKALSFCDTDEERFWFQKGMLEEHCDHTEMAS